jgi:hypothetical protein
VRPSLSRQSSQVTQLDSEQLDTELSEVLGARLLRANQHTWWLAAPHSQQRVAAIVELLLHLSAVVGERASPGAEMWGLRLRDACGGDGPDTAAASRSQRCAYGALTPACPTMA